MKGEGEDGVILVENGFRGLRVWQKGDDFSVKIYRMTDSGTFGRDFGLRDQMRRAAVSIPSNIAEGDELDTNKQSIRHFYIAKGSCAEVLTQAVIACKIGYLDEDKFKTIENEAVEIAKMLSKLISARRNK